MNDSDQNHDQIQEALEFMELPNEAIDRIGEVDRTEVIEAYYRCILTEDRRAMRLTHVDINPTRTVDAWSDADVRERIGKWRTELETGGAIFGAQSHGKLRGFSIVSANRPNGSTELVALFVDMAYRGRGVGTRLYAMAEERANEASARAMYIGANPFVPCIDFYLARGAQIVRMTDVRLFSALPGSGITLAKIF